MTSNNPNCLSNYSIRPYAYDPVFSPEEVRDRQEEEDRFVDGQRDQNLLW